jgi:glycosyltransferase involved in cell wall biosynthesis
VAVTRQADAQRDRAHRAAVPPVDIGVPRPVWSVMIPTYNCAPYLETALRGVLTQAPGPERMQIEVVDDHSTADDPEEIVRQIGERRVGFYRQPRNRGVVGNLNTCLRRAHGELVHLLHGDDAVLPGFYETMGAIFDADPEVAAAYCRHIYIDEVGRWLDLAPLEPASSGRLADGMRFLGSEQRVMTPCIVVRRSAYEALHGFDDRLQCAEDWEMWVRIASRFPVYYEQRPLACYRMHASSNTGRNIRSGHDLDHTRLAIEMFTRYAAPGAGREIRRVAFRTYARSALVMARRLARDGDRAGMRAQLGVAWKLRKSPRVLAEIATISTASLAARRPGAPGSQRAA